MSGVNLKHTPGPWEVSHGGTANDDGFSIVSKSCPELVCERWPCYVAAEDRDRLAADAALIAAAPEMLELLRETYDAIGSQAFRTLAEQSIFSRLNMLLGRF